MEDSLVYSFTVVGCDQLGVLMSDVVKTRTRISTNDCELKSSAHLQLEIHHQKSQLNLNKRPILCIKLTFVFQIMWVHEMLQSMMLERHQRRSSASGCTTRSCDKLPVKSCNDHWLECRLQTQTVQITELSAPDPTALCLYMDHCATNLQCALNKLHFHSML